MIMAELNKDSLARINSEIGMFVKGLNIEMEVILKQTVKQMAEALCNSTPPYKIITGGAPTTNLEGKKLGEKAVKRDLTRLIKPVQDCFPKGVKDKKVSDIINRRKTEQALPILRSFPGSGTEAKILPFSEDLHKKNVGTGRYYVKKGTGTYTWDKTKANAYTKLVQSRVGYSKSGWHLVAVAHGAREIGWLSRHFPYSKGWFLNIHQGKGIESISFQNTAPQLRRHIPEYNKALNSLAGRMSKDFQTKMKYLLRNK